MGPERAGYLPPTRDLNLKSEVELRSLHVSVTFFLKDLQIASITRVLKSR